MKILFTPLQGNHFPLLLKWLETPHVKAWWDQDVRWTPELIKEKYGEYVRGVKRLALSDKVLEKPMHAFIICVNGQEIGYIQYYDAYDFPREPKLEGLSQDIASLDIFIGEKSAIGKGWSALILTQFLKEHIFKHFEAVFVDPDTANTQAIRAYEKAGFKKVKTVKDGTITWMMRRKM